MAAPVVFVVGFLEVDEVEFARVQLSIIDGRLSCCESWGGEIGVSIGLLRLVDVSGLALVSAGPGKVCEWGRGENLAPLYCGDRGGVGCHFL